MTYSDIGGSKEQIEKMREVRIRCECVCVCVWVFGYRQGMRGGGRRVGEVPQLTCPKWEEGACSCQVRRFSQQPLFCNFLAITIFSTFLQSTLSTVRKSCV